MSTNDPPLVSFIVPVRNDAVRLRRCIASIRATDYRPDQLEILVADNGSDDGSAGVARDAGARVLSLPGVPVAKLRNDAARDARGEVLAFIDADHEIVAAWPRSATETLMTPQVAAVGAQYHAPDDSTWVQRQYDRLRRRHSGVRDVDWLAGGNMAVRRSAFEAVGGFDERLETCEDVDLCQRLRARGLRVVSDARLKSTHFGDPATLGQLFRSELWRGRDNIRVSLRPPLLLRNVVGLLVPVLELILLAAAAAGLAFWASRGPLLALASLAGIFAIACLQTFRMLRSSAGVRPLDLIQTLLVAGVYGIARALALIVRTPHRVRQQGERAVA